MEVWHQEIVMGGAIEEFVWAKVWAKIVTLYNIGLAKP